MFDPRIGCLEPYLAIVVGVRKNDARQALADIGVSDPLVVVLVPGQVGNLHET